MKNKNIFNSGSTNFTQSNGKNSFDRLKEKDYKFLKASFIVGFFSLSGFSMCKVYNLNLANSYLSRAQLFSVYGACIGIFTAVFYIICKKYEEVHYFKNKSLFNYYQRIVTDSDNERSDSDETEKYIKN